MSEIDDNTPGLRNRLLTVVVVTILILTGVYILYAEEPTSTNPEFNLYTNDKKLISGSFFVELDVADSQDYTWQYEAAVAFIPMVMGEKVLGGDEVRPLIFGASPRKPSSISKYSDTQTLKISEFGDNPNEVTIKIAKEYWADIDTVIIASGYEYALLTSPLATLLDLPIIIDGRKTKDFIDDENIKSVITVGREKEIDDIGIKHLSDRLAIWEMYLEELQKHGEKCEYIVVTNPHDIDFDNPDLYIPGLSLASGILAAGRNALIVSGEYTTKLEYIQTLGYGLGDAGSGERGDREDNITDEVEEEYQKSINRRAGTIDQDIDEAAEFLEEREQTPKHVALVGGPVAVPMLYLKSPIWYEGVDQEEKGEEYVATDIYYGDLDIKISSDQENIPKDISDNYDHMNGDLYEQEMAVGRIVAQDLNDASALVARSLGYWNYEFDSGNLLEITHWSKRALIVTSLMTGDSDNFAAKHQREVFIENLMLAEEYDPNRIAATTDVGGLDVKDQMEEVNGIIYDGHGYPDGWYHMWASTGSEESDWDRIGAEDINSLTLHAVPVFGACCLSSALDWPAVGGGSSNEKKMTPEECMSLAFIHAGAMCYIGATEESWGSFFGGLLDEDPDAWGYGDFDLPAMFWDSLLKGNMEIGWALNHAKEKFLEEIWTDAASKPFARLCMLETVLYGDPAAMNGHPGFNK